MRTPEAALTEHAARMLIGTDVTFETAADVASGRLPAIGPVAAALRDGWASAEHVKHAETLGQEL